MEFPRSHEIKQALVATALVLGSVASVGSAQVIEAHSSFRAVLPDRFELPKPQEIKLKRGKS